MCVCVCVCGWGGEGEEGGAGIRSHLGFPKRSSSHLVD